MALSKTFCPAVAIYDAKFTDVDDYYRMFPHEMADSKLLGLDIQDRIQISNITFQSLLEQMRDSRLAHRDWDDFLIVAHGLLNQMDYAYGLTMPIAPNCINAPTSVDVLRPLLGFLDNDASDAQIDAFERNPDFTIKNSKGKMVKPTFAQGCLQNVVDLMRQLRTLRVRRVEFRACALGTNEDAMEVLGRCFSALWVGAPDEHMFYTRAHPGRPVNTDTLKSQLRAHPTVRVFTTGGDSFTYATNGPEVPKTWDGSDSFAFQIQGRTVFRTNFAATTMNDVSWFVDKYIWDGSSYPRSQSAMPTSFMIAGIDLFGSKRYVLPQEPEYSQHIIYKGPLPGNQIYWAQPR
jgi:hypothetical protein